MTQKNAFYKGVERLVNPIEVGAIHFIQGINKLLPLSIQEKLTAISTKKYPLMGFVVEPYSSFLFYEVIDIEAARKLLPDSYTLLKTKVFETDKEAKYYVIQGTLRVHTSAFWGTRIEFYLVAEDTKTGLLTWVIIDYDSNTIGQDKKFGLRDPNSKNAVVTVNHRGVIVVDIPNATEKRRLAYQCPVTTGTMQPLDQRLWLEGNLSVAYGKELSRNKAVPFGLIFEPCEVEKALEVPLSDVVIEENSWYPGLFAKEPTKVVVFPYAQHFLANTLDQGLPIRNKEALEKALKDIQFDKIEPISASSAKYLFLGLLVMVFLLTVALILLTLR